ncbi:MAG TPA: hypothetical protein VF668_21310 [Pyrinomonadaceae bacterium]
MRHKLKMTLAVAALQLVALLPGAGAAAHARGERAADGVASGRGGAPAPQRRARRPRRKPAGDALIPGVWGGEHIRFEVTEQGANVEYDCARGAVEGKIIVDGRGRFEVAGTHYEEHGGPVRSDERAVGHPVRLSGVVGGSLLKLTVRRADTKELIGVFSLARDREPNLFKCR